MENNGVWVCVAAVAIVGIVAMAFLFKNGITQQAGVSYIYDNQDRLQSIVPIENFKQVTLKPVS